MAANLPLIRERERLIAGIRRLTYCPRELLDRMSLAELEAILKHWENHPDRRRALT